jgi:hypothetical protein
MLRPLALASAVVKESPTSGGPAGLSTLLGNTGAGANRARAPDAGAQHLMMNQELGLMRARHNNATGKKRPRQGQSGQHASTAWEARIMPYLLFYTVGGHVRATEYETLEAATVAYNGIRERYLPAWVCDDEDQVVIGKAPEDGMELSR